MSKRSDELLIIDILESINKIFQKRSKPGTLKFLGRRLCPCGIV
jgi:hypothetical protein